MCTVKVRMWLCISVCIEGFLLFWARVITICLLNRRHSTPIAKVLKLLMKCLNEFLYLLNKQAELDILTKNCVSILLLLVAAVLSDILL